MNKINGAVVAAFIVGSTAGAGGAGAILGATPAQTETLIRRDLKTVFVEEARIVRRRTEDGGVSNYYEVRGTVDEVTSYVDGGVERTQIRLPNVAVESTSDAENKLIGDLLNGPGAKRLRAANRMP